MAIFAKKEVKKVEKVNNLGKKQLYMAIFAKKVKKHSKSDKNSKSDQKSPSRLKNHPPDPKMGPGGSQWESRFVIWGKIEIYREKAQEFDSTESSSKSVKKSRQKCPLSRKHSRFLDEKPTFRPLFSISIAGLGFYRRIPKSVKKGSIKKSKNSFEAGGDVLSHLSGITDI
jgi:hypothetical protein